MKEGKTLRPGIKLWLEKENAILGPGTVRLFRAIDATGAVREACSVCNVSYSKGWKMLRSAESEMGVSLVERKVGGTAGGEARLTEECRELLQKYERFQKEMKEEAERRFRKIFFDDECF